MATLQDIFLAVAESVEAGDPAAYLAARETYQADAPPEDELAEVFRGESPAEALRMLGEQLDQEDDPASALSMCEVAVLLEPDNPAHRKTRGLVHMSLLQPQAAAEDFAVLAERGDDFAVLLGAYLQVVFPPSFFAPTRFPGGELASGHDRDVTCVRDLGEVRWQIQVYATRIQALRQALKAYGGDSEAPWMPSGLEAVLPDGPVILQQWSYPSAWDEDQEIEVDETLPDDVTGLNALGVVRAEWSAMTLLCWLVGLDQLGLPIALNPRPDFVGALGWAEFFLWRSRDQQLSGGAASEETGLPGFAWRGLDIAELSPILAAVAAEEASEVQAMLRWLTDQDVRSPFAEGLRDS